MSFEASGLVTAAALTLRGAAGLLWRTARRARRLLLPRGLDCSERDFIAANRDLWDELGQARSAQHGWILVAPQTHPVLMHGNASFAAICARARGLRLLFILESHSQRGADRSLLASYPGAGFVYLDSPRFALTWLHSWLRAARVYRHLREPRDILELNDDGMRYGDLIYDSLLGRGYATVRSIDLSTLATLQRYFFYAVVMAGILRQHDIRAYVTVHGYIGILDGTLTRVVLRQRIEVLNRVGTHQLIVRKYRGPHEIGNYIFRPEPRYVSAMLADQSGVAREHADRYIEERFAQAVDDVAVKIAFSRTNRLFVDRADFAAAHGLDPSKPLVFVMLHEFTDSPHSHFRRPLMFQDYYEWFVQTLEHVRSITSVNWIVKEHPLADHYPTKDLDLHRLFSGIHDPHIRFLDSHDDFNAASIRYIAHAIVTCIGTAGMEYSCFGIPCVLAGESPYSGFGFTLEPPDRAAYFLQLKGIVGLGRLTPEQVRVARAVTWFQLGLLPELADVLGPRYEYWQIKEMQVDLWGDVAALLRSLDRTVLRRQIEMIEAYLAAPDYVQLVDVARYPFLRPATGLPCD